MEGPLEGRRKNCLPLVQMFRRQKKATMHVLARGMQSDPIMLLKYIMDVRVKVQDASV
jgi:hypothetical protein